MKKSKKKVASITKDVNRQKKRCKDLSKGLAVKYSEMGVLADGLITGAALALIGDNRCEDTIHSGPIVVQTLQKLYKSEAVVRVALDEALGKQLWGTPINEGKVMEGLVQFYKMIFNFYTPGWVDMQSIDI